MEENPNRHIPKDLCFNNSTPPPWTLKTDADILNQKQNLRQEAMLKEGKSYSSSSGDPKQVSK